ncbi:oxidoreductase [Melanomma pulvis-pyrius CBS 109.77]|uniref:Oxidoreductase n=1 Tax=Melanomma pulvis-pyrius CBS 109.77 TaxID=1314802 RepID=A0A6A6XF31_9PLEO|nr:oxidoreductase [Melanomma pulvis-pyrius CBS 109.77]
MASEKLFRYIPPFPDDVPTTPMHVISLQRLRSADTTASKEVMNACQELGFFLLDLRGDELGETVIGEVDALFEVGQKILNLPDDVKEKYLNDAPKSFLGFKPRGQAKTETNEPDRFEWFNLGQDGLLGNTNPQPLPPLINSHNSLFTSFLQHGQTIVSTIASTLATQLGLPADTFTALQAPHKPSGTVIRIIKAFASPDVKDLRTSMIHHTDFGTITLLANVLGGLQILAPGKLPTDDAAWSWVKPQPGCLIVNLGDAMVQWSGGLLRSNVHRINYAPGLQRLVDRYSLAILVRPERNASMKRLVGEPVEGEEDGEGLSAWEWEVKKAMALTKGEAVMQSKGGKAAANI